MYPNRCQRSFRSKHSVPSHFSLSSGRRSRGDEADAPSGPIDLIALRGRERGPFGRGPRRELSRTLRHAVTAAPSVRAFARPPEFDQNFTLPLIKRIHADRFSKDEHVSHDGRGGHAIFKVKKPRNCSLTSRDRRSWFAPSLKHKLVKPSACWRLGFVNASESLLQ